MNDLFSKFIVLHLEYNAQKSQFLLNRELNKITFLE
jgi:hypothetical protein